MNLLLDTHVVLWWVSQSQTLSRESRNAIESPENQKVISAAVVWEIAIKQALGKLDIPPRFYDWLNLQPVTHLPVTRHHARAISTLPLHHIRIRSTEC